MTHDTYRPDRPDKQADRVAAEAKRIPNIRPKGSIAAEPDRANRPSHLDVRRLLIVFHDDSILLVPRATGAVRPICYVMLQLDGDGRP